MSKQERDSRYQENSPFVRIDRETYDRLVYYSRFSGRSIKEISGTAIKKYLDEIKSGHEKNEATSFF